MIREYDICGVKTKLGCSANIPWTYREYCGRDILRDFNELNEKLSGGLNIELAEKLVDIVYIMACEAGYDGEREEFLRLYDNPAFAYVAVGPMYDLWNAGMQTTSEPAKKKETQRGRTTARSSC